MAIEQSTDFGYLLRSARREAGLTQEELAERAGISTRAVSDLERGINRAPRRDTLDMLAEALDLSEDQRRNWERARRMLARRTGSVTSSMDSPSPGQLPPLLSSFVGRDHEIDRVVRLLQEPGIRLLTLTGPGGVGKTRLSLAVADRVADNFPDGVWFVDLSALNDHRHVLPAIASTLNVNLSGNQPALMALIDVLVQKRVLVLLDNVEHVLKCALQIGELVRACPSITVLVTSRAPLQVQGEREYALSPLTLPDEADSEDIETVLQSEAVTLFVQRAQAVRPDFTVTGENSKAVSMICRRLDGIPLAIELAAARTRMLSPQAMLSRLEHSLPFLTGGALDLPPRQQALRDTIAWSYDLLPPDSQRLFQYLSVFRGGWTLESAAAASGDDDVIEPLERLVEHSLVRVGEQPNGEPRYTMLETIREFGLEQLAGAGLEHAAHSRHGHYFLQLSETAIPFWRRYSPQDPYRQLQIERDNLRAALIWFMEHDHVASCRLSGALWRFFSVHGDASEGRHWLEATLAQTSDLPTAVRARVVEGIAMMTYVLMDLETFRSRMKEAYSLWQEAGDRSGIAWALLQLSRPSYKVSDYALAVEYCNQSLAIYRELNDLVGIAYCLNVLGIIANLSGDKRAARRLYQESLDLRREVGDEHGAAQSLRNLGLIAMEDGDHVRAKALIEESIALTRTSNMEHVESEMLLHLARIALLEGDSRRARNLLGDSIRLFHQERVPYWVVQCLNQFARIAALDGDPVRVASLGGAIETITARHNVHVNPARHFPDGVEQTIEDARDQVDADIWSDAWARGRRMSLAEVVEYASGAGQQSAG